MIRRLLSAVAAVVVLAGCAPTETPADIASLDAQACAAQGGEIRPAGRMQVDRCIIAYADAGQPCTDGGQCQGECRFQGDAEAAAAAQGPVTGICQADSDPFGCFTNITDGRAEPTLCVD